MLVHPLKPVTPPSVRLREIQFVVILISAEGKLSQSDFTSLVILYHKMSVKLLKNPCICFVCVCFIRVLFIVLSNLFVCCAVSVIDHLAVDSAH
jgi:hypothetical protein